MNNDNNQSMVLGSVDNTSNQTPITETNQTNNGIIDNLGESQIMTGSVMMPESNTSSNNTVMDGANSIPLTEPTPQTETPPAYTNPQTISGPSQNNFQPQNTIGTTPPVSLEPEKKPKKKMSKTSFIIIIIILLVGVGLGTYYVLNYTDLLTKKEEITIETKNLEINIGETLPESITEYATITGTNVSNCNPVDATQVNVNEGGVYKYTITCGDVSKIGTITVIDNIEIAVETKTVYKSVGETLNASEFAANNNDGLKYEFAEQSEVDTALANNTGTYTIGLKVSKGVKTVDAIGKLVMLNYPVKGYVTCESNSQIVSSISASKVVAEKFGILDDEGKNSYAGFGYEVTTFTFNDVTIFKSYQDEYNQKNTVTIDGVAGITEFSTDDDGKNVIKITKELDNSNVLLEYGADNMKDYSSIMKYFGKSESGLGYNCTYQKA